MSQHIHHSLAAIVGPSAVISEKRDMEPYATDWRGIARPLPIAVVRPKHVDEVAKLVQFASANDIPIVPQGGNTGLAFGATPAGSGAQILISFSRMSAIRSVDPVGMTMEVEAGVILANAQDAAASVSRLLPISLAAEGSAQIGGVISSNAGGTNVVKYGMTRQLVLGLEVVLADGTIMSGLRHLRKDNAGYDWKQLFIGSEGTLGLVTAAVLRLLPRPSQKVTALLAVPSAESALSLLSRMQEQLGDTINAFELISGLSFELVEKQFDLKPPIERADWYVLLEASATISGLRDGAEASLATALEEGYAVDGVIAESEQQTKQLWALREHITEAELREGRSLKHDVSVPIPQLPRFLDRTTRKVVTAFPGARVNAFGHAGDGNVHFNIILPPETAASDVNRSVHDEVISFGGSISAEHGIGAYRVDELAHYKTGSELDFCRRIKDNLDPMWLLNRGKVIRPNSP